jgi:hypothetical protein
MSKNKQSRQHLKTRLDQLRGLPISSNGRLLTPGTREYERQLRVLATSTSEGELQPPQEFIAREGGKWLRGLGGKLEWDASFDYKKERTRR